MLYLNKENIKNKKLWENANVKTPEFDLERTICKTSENPIWVHFGAGNIFRGYIANLQQKLLENGLAEKGIVAVETFDFEIIDRIYKPYDNIGILVTLYPDGGFTKKIIASIPEALVGDPSRSSDWLRLKEIFKNPSLQMASFTITEKGYNINQLSGEYLQEVKKDIEMGPQNPIHIMSKVAALTYTRYKNGKHPIALVSMDNCAGNGKRLSSAVKTIAKAWIEKGFIEKEFINYLNSSDKVSFPWTMIDKITPRPAEEIKGMLDSVGIAKMDILRTSKNTFIAPFVNAEQPEYLVVEDSFPNGRPLLENVGVIFTDRDTVDKVEKMKVGTCLNPLHTALAIFGCLLGYETIAQEMQDDILKKLVTKIGLEEGMPVVINPGVIDPVKFIKEVIDVRLPNPFIPDTPQRIATDTSQKIRVRFGQLISAYKNSPHLDASSLVYIPLTLAGWCRYLLGIGDSGEEMALSPDPMLETLKPYFEGIELGNPESANGKLKRLLSNEELFGVNLYEVGLGDKVEQYFGEMIAGENAVRNTLIKHLENND